MGLERSGDVTCKKNYAGGLQPGQKGTQARRRGAAVKAHDQELPHALRYREIVFSLSHLAAYTSISALSQGGVRTIETEVIEAAFSARQADSVPPRASIGPIPVRVIVPVQVAKVA